MRGVDCEYIQLSPNGIKGVKEEKSGIHGRSGRVTLLRMKVVLAGLTCLGTEERIRRAERVDDGRRSIEDMLN